MDFEIRSGVEPVIVTENDMVLLKGVELYENFLEDLDKLSENGEPAIVILTKGVEVCVIRDYKHNYKERVKWGLKGE